MMKKCDICGQECKGKMGLKQHKSQSHTGKNLLESWRNDM